MKEKLLIKIIESEQHGIVVECQGLETSDRFEDFMTEVTDLDFQVKFGIDSVTFYMGRNISISKMQKLVEEFELAQ